MNASQPYSEHLVSHQGSNISVRHYAGTGPAFALMHGFPEDEIKVGQTCLRVYVGTGLAPTVLAVSPQGDQESHVSHQPLGTMRANYPSPRKTGTSGVEW